MTIWRSRFKFALAFMMLSPAPVPVQAQSSPPGQTTCLNRAIFDASGASQPLTIYVPVGESGTYAARGFVAGACGAMSLAEYRTEACRLAHTGNDAVQARLTEILGASPKDLCESVKRAAPIQAATPGN